MERGPCVYILASGRHGTLYTGVTSNLFQRLWQHRNGVTKGFVGRYAVWRLVWFEMHGDMESAMLERSGSRTGGGTGRSS